jgi:hypothetical protein
MRKRIAFVSEVKYKCRSETDVGMMKAGGIIDMSVKEIRFRNYVEYYGRRYVVNSISGFEKWKGVQITIPSNTEKIEEN